jgi:hypothetical protein
MLSLKNENKNLSLDVFTAGVFLFGVEIIFEVQ